MYTFSKTRKAECIFCHTVSTLIISAVLFALSTIASADDTKLQPFISLQTGGVLQGEGRGSGDVPFNGEIGVELSNSWGAVTATFNHHSNVDRTGEEYDYEALMVEGKLYLGCWRGDCRK